MKAELFPFQKRALEKFFRSSWYQQLTSVDGEFLIRKLQNEIRQSE